MHEEPSDKLFIFKGEGLSSTGFVVLDPKGNGFLTHFKDSGVADGDLVGISTQVLNDLISTFKRLFEVGNPLFGIQFCQKPVEFGRVFKDAELARESQSLFDK